MKRKNLILLTGICILLVTCQKSVRITRAGDLQSFINRAQRYFTDSVLALSAQPEGYRGSGTKRIKWDAASAAVLPFGKGVWVPVEYTDPLFVRTSFSDNRNFSLNNLTWLLMYSDTTNHLHAELVTRLPDSMYLKDPTGPFSGYVFVEDWWGHSLAKYLYSNNTVRKYVTPRVQPTGFVTYCTVIFGYNYSPNSANDGYSWVETTGCYTAYEPDNYDLGTSGGGYGGNIGGGGAGAPTLTSIFVVSGKNPIANITDYLKCFTNVGGNDHNYTVTVCVDQPTPGSRNPWTTTSGGLAGSSAAGNAFNVGHTFLIFSEQYGGTNITRNIGFYPSGTVTPRNPSSQGQLSNNEDHIYNISATFTVTNANFFAMLNFVSQGNSSGFLYNLNSENCTTFSLQTLIQGGIYLPNTIGDWLNGMGNNPGDLGEDIRQMNLLPNMTRNTVANYHPNIGNCQ